MTESLASRIRQANAVLLAGGDLDAIDDYFAPDYVAHLTDRELKGTDAVATFIRRLRHAFTDLELDVEVLVEADDRIAWQRTMRGTHEGDFAGFPATGTETVWRDMVTTRFRDGRIAEEWSISDLAEQLLRARK